MGKTPLAASIQAFEVQVVASYDNNVTIWTDTSPDCGPLTITIIIVLIITLIVLIARVIYLWINGRRVPVLIYITIVAVIVVIIVIEIQLPGCMEITSYIPACRKYRTTA